MYLVILYIIYISCLLFIYLNIYLFIYLYILSILLPNLSWQIYPNLNFLCCISSFEGNSYKNYKIQSLVLYFLIVLQELLHLQISIFTIF